MTDTQEEVLGNAEGVYLFPLSYAQQRLWFLDQLMPGNPAYNISTAVRLQGTLHPDALFQALRQIAARHETLVTSFREVDGAPMQVIDPELTLDLALLDLSGYGPDEQGAQMAARIAAQSQEPFDLQTAPLLRLSLLKLSEAEHVLLLTMHHIISDGWSMNVMIHELSLLYNAAISGGAATLPELAIQYADYGEWQREYLESGVLAEQLAYWREKLGGDLPILQLPADRKRPVVQTQRGALEIFLVPLELADKLRALSQREGVSLFMTLLAAFKTLLFRYTNQTDLLVGTPIAGRTREEIEPLIGFFVNTLVMRTELSGNISFRELLQRVKNTAFDAYAHQDVPFERLVEELAPERNLSHTPLFQVMFNLQNTSVEGMSLTGLTLEALDVDTGSAGFDLTLSMTEGKAGITSRFEYNCDLFDRSTIERMVTHFLTLLEAAAGSPEAELGALPILTEAERTLVIETFNNNTVDVPEELCMHQLFERQAELLPDAVAVEYLDEKLTYRELNQRANRLAHHLQQLGVGPEKLVGLCIHRSLDLVVGLLGIQKAGGAFLPLDPDYPPERLRYLLEDAQAAVLLTESQLLPQLPEHSGHTVCFDIDAEKIAAQSADNCQSDVRPENLAYVIYTSGSTGAPKGAMLEHRNGVSHHYGVIDRYNVQPSDRIVQFTSISFDVTVEEIFPTLACGATVVLRPHRTLTSSEEFLAWLGEQQISKFNPPTAYMHAFLQDLAEQGLTLPPTLRLLIAGGERMQPALVRAWREVATEHNALYNGYGPTETTVTATVYNETLPDDDIPIGRPVANAQTYVLDDRLQPVPIGVPGELYIGGKNVGRGYLGRPELTAERYLPNPFRPGERIYKTGDIVRVRADGNLLYLGRGDGQVKIRGYRIELGEVENALAEATGVREAVVLDREDTPGQKYLAAYVTLKETGQTSSDLRKELAERLPDYMIPSVFVILDEMPMTPNGKVNRAALPKPDSARPELGTDYIAPKTELEMTIAEIWQEVLGVKRVGVHDNFFELGGGSLLILQVHRKLKERIGVETSVVQLFQYPTVSALAKFLGDAGDETSVKQGQDRADRRKDLKSRRAARTKNRRD
ncbi:amino acid adenylation domain-containing protein [Tumebacillus sp. BK434]|uniref:non-ribosomal peptide synthetase n=1 Tax=Tumebacillus sp. BK434 TaxID=2512169 RepID=UPI0010F19360|nr:non-ribosomal peptide synthetase [Tumebacillus sp. BK434]TCP54505.1 amino acid adenylation domain-containing protein [Tumebacillus sp. BK434]